MLPEIGQITHEWEDKIERMQSLESQLKKADQNFVGKKALVRGEYFDDVSNCEDCFWEGIEECSQHQYFSFAFESHEVGCKCLPALIPSLKTVSSIWERIEEVD